MDEKTQRDIREVRRLRTFAAETGQDVRPYDRELAKLSRRVRA